MPRAGLFSTPSAFRSDARGSNRHMAKKALIQKQQRKPKFKVRGYTRCQRCGRPKAVFRILRKAAFNNVDRKRLYKEAKTFLKVRAMRHKWVKDKHEKDDSAAAVAPAKA